MSLEQLLFWNSYFVFKDIYFLEITSCLFYNSQSSFLAFVNWKGCYLDERFLHNLFPCFDIVPALLVVIPRINFVEIVAAVECYLITTHVKNKESKK